MPLHHLYHPITSTPFQQTAQHVETAPSKPLLPFIRCFWGPPKKREGGESVRELVIPDTCMDLIFETDRKTGNRSARFCTISDVSFVSNPSETIVKERFGIRFYPWTAARLTVRPLTGTKNGCYDGELFFPSLVKAVLDVLKETPAFPERCARTEKILYEALWEKMDAPDCLNVLEGFLRREGRWSVQEAAESVCVSERQLERLFAASFGVTPKTMMRLLRYQCLWQSAVFDPSFRQADAAIRFGYTDQSHMANEFRLYHAMPLKQALQLARDPVVFLQERERTLR